MSLIPRREPSSRSERGQALVELTLIVPIMILLLAGVIEIGLVANDTITLGYGAREGARAGSSLGDGGAIDCDNGADPFGVDQTIVAGVQRIIESSSSDVALADVQEIQIFEATSSGAKVANHVNTWRYTGADSGPDIDPTEGVDRLDFSAVSSPWPACSRESGGATPDIIGVEVTYRRQLVSPLASLLSTVGIAPAMTLQETTVMTLNPSF